MIKQAVILAGGKGERLRPFTEDRPKAMIELFGNPIMSYQIQWLKTYGFKQIIIACGYRHEVIKDYFGNGSIFDLDIQYAIEETPLGRGGALKQAIKMYQQPECELVLAVNGDHVTNLDINKLIAFHQNKKPMATIVTVPLRSPYGIVEMDENNTVTGFREKPELPYNINAGTYLLDPAIVSDLPDIGDHEETTFPMLTKLGKLKAYKSNEFWRTVDTAKDLFELRKELESGSLLQPISV